MRAMGLQPKKGEVEAMIAEVDADGSGSIDFEEFVSLMSSKIGAVGSSLRQISQGQRLEIRRTFDYFDKVSGRRQRQSLWGRWQAAPAVQCAARAADECAVWEWLKPQGWFRVEGWPLCGNGLS